MKELIFSWAENDAGRLVHVDTVANGLNCNCVCPNCKEELLARHGEERAHGFAHRSEKRRANIKICYKVTLYKLAEQTIQEAKRVHVPSYYGIFKEQDIVFDSVEVYSRYGRTDRQPDVIGKTSDGKQYLIELSFADKVQHFETIDYSNFNCLEIDLSRQTMETLRGFLLDSCKDRRWLNNQDYFDSIELVYKTKGHVVQVKEESECMQCCLMRNCCGVRSREATSPLEIDNNGKIYRICKPDERESKIRQMQREAQRRFNEECITHPEAVNRHKDFGVENEITFQLNNGGNLKRRWRNRAEESLYKTSLIPHEKRSCFECLYNCGWETGNEGLCSQKRGIEQPETAQSCDLFRVKSRQD